MWSLHEQANHLMCAKQVELGLVVLSGNEFNGLGSQVGVYWMDGNRFIFSMG